MITCHLRENIPTKIQCMLPIAWQLGKSKIVKTGFFKDRNMVFKQCYMLPVLYRKLPLHTTDAVILKATHLSSHLILLVDSKSAQIFPLLRVSKGCRQGISRAVVSYGVLTEEEYILFPLQTWSDFGRIPFLMAVRVTKLLIFAVFHLEALVSS